MIKWCAYCQQFMHECRPFEDYQITHGICKVCFPKVAASVPKDKQGLEGVTSFYRSMEKIAFSGSTRDVAAILEESRRLGIRPLDLMMGILQPLLAQIGELWLANKISVAEEHRFSTLVGDLLALSRQEQPGDAQRPAPELIMLNALDNYHVLGLQMAEVFFSTQGIPTLTVVPGLPTTEIIDLLALHRPRALGVSVALPAHMQQVREVVNRLGELPAPPTRILVGGPAIRLGLEPDPSHRFTLCNTFDDALLALGVPGETRPT
jgi:methanogenic corrinoid protein MtbC1